MVTYICFCSGYEYLFNVPEEEENTLELVKCFDGCGLDQKAKTYDDLPIVFIHGKGYGRNSTQFTYKNKAYDENYEQLVSKFKEMSNSDLKNAICFQFEEEGNALWTQRPYLIYMSGHMEAPISVYRSLETYKLDGKKFIYLRLD